MCERSRRLIRRLRGLGPRGPALAFLLCLFGLAVAATPAAAAPSKFIYLLCDPALPGGNPPAARFTVNPGVPFTPFQTCAQPGGSIGITETGSTAGQFAWWSFAIPATPGGYVEAATVSGSASGLGPGNNHTYAYEQGWPVNGAGESRRVFQNSEGEAPFYFSYDIFRIFLNCDGNYAPGCGAGPTIAIHDIAATEVDLNPPVLASISGSLLAPGVLRGHQELSAVAGDIGGGVSRLEVLVNGIPAPSPTLAPCAVVAVANPSYTGIAAITPSPCPPQLKANWTLDTAASPFQQGANTVQVCASDFSTITEATKVCSLPRALAVDNSCTESPVAGGQMLSAEFARSHNQEVTVPFDKGARVRGDLANDSGEPISGATICVQLETPGSPRGLVPVGTATTDASGHYTYDIHPGPNRRVLIGYRHDSFQVGRSIRYYSHVRPTIKLSAGKLHNGDVLKIKGKLPGGHRAAGRVVVLQAGALHSKKWYPFGETTTNAEGRYHYEYRFVNTTTKTTYGIRASVPRQDDYFYRGGHSKTALVEVRR